MSDEALFRKMDEDERIYAPQELPSDQQERVLADDGPTQQTPDGDPVAAPVNTSDNLLFGLTTTADVEDDADEPGPNDPRVLPPMPIRSGPGMGQIG